MKAYQTCSVEQTLQIASLTAQDYLDKGGIIALIGDLGTGKTIFTQGFARGLGIEEKIISPTFVLIRQHQIPSTKRVLYHIDLYRLENQPIDMVAIGIKELIDNPTNIILIEWAEKIKNKLPDNTIWIQIAKVNDTVRKISIS